MAEAATENPKIGLLASGGAPNLHLIAGALCALHERKTTFEVIGASGAGALAGLLYAVPKGPGGPVAALEGTIHLNVSDAIYQLLPMNFKAFFKTGPFTNLFWKFGQSIPHRPLSWGERNHDALARLYNDSIDFIAAALTPTTLNYFSKSVCTRIGVIDDLIDWVRLPTYSGEFYLNAFDLKTQRLKAFDKKNLTNETFWAALAMPWLFEPTAAQGGLYTEGASHDPSGLEALWEYAHKEVEQLDMIIALDTIGPNLWTNPGNIYDALQMAIMDPIVSLAETVLTTYGQLEFTANSHYAPKQVLPRLYWLPFEVPDWEAQHVLEWSYSNALTLWHVGYDAGKKFSKALDAARDDPARLELEKYRYHQGEDNTQRTIDFLELFKGVLDAKFPRPSNPSGKRK
jgi:NTE family protein